MESPLAKDKEKMKYDPEEYFPEADESSFWRKRQKEIDDKKLDEYINIKIEQSKEDCHDGKNQHPNR